MVRDEVSAAVDVVAEDAARFRHAYQRWERAVARRDRLVARAYLRLLRATGGLGYRRWALACRRQSIETVAEAVMVARAIRAGEAVQGALAERDRVRAAEEATVLAARIALAEASKAMARYGRLGEQLSGVTRSELRRLARRPPAAAPI
ncbi:MAG: hypothetical protein ACYDH5_18540 [Acidimicrobiales bacterium]